MFRALRENEIRPETIGDGSGGRDKVPDLRGRGISEIKVSRVQDDGTPFKVDIDSVEPILSHQIADRVDEVLTVRLGRQLHQAIGAADREQDFLSFALQLCDIGLDFGGGSARIGNELNRRTTTGRRLAERHVYDIEISGDVAKPNEAGPIIEVMPIPDQNSLRDLTPASAAASSGLRGRHDLIA